DHLLCIRRVNIADRDDPAVLHGDVGHEGGCSRTVTDLAATKDEVVGHCRTHSTIESIPYSATALVPTSPARAESDMPSLCSSNSSTTPGYLASLWGKSLAHMKVCSPAKSARSLCVCSPGSNETTHWRWKYSLGFMDRGAAAHL